MRGFYSFLLLSIFAFFSCAGTNLRILTFDQYGFMQHGSESVQTKGDIVISVKVLRPTDMYSYPQYFTFVPDSLSVEFRESAFVQATYQPSVNAKTWEYILASPEYANVLIAFHTKISNNSEHILRMKDARIYLIVDGSKAIPYLATDKELEEKVTAFEREFVGNRWYRTYPKGLYSAILEQNKKQFKLLADVGEEILPGFSLEGLLVFPMHASELKNTKLSFFDITTKTDDAGSAIEKSRFDFALRREPACMQYNDYTKKWESCESAITLK